MESINSEKRYTYVKGVVKFLRNKSTVTGKAMQMFAVVGEHTEVCSFFPDEAEDRFVVSLSGYYIFLIHDSQMTLFIIIINS